MCATFFAGTESNGQIIFENLSDKEATIKGNEAILQRSSKQNK